VTQLVGAVTALALVGGFLSTGACAAERTDLSVLLDGVKIVDAPGLPGPVCAFGDAAFAVVVGGRKGGQLPLVVASRFGKGRVVGFGKDGFLDAGTLDLGDTGRLMANAARWAAGGKESPSVGVVGHNGFAEALVKRGLNARQVAVGQLDGLDVLCVSPSQVPRDNLPRLFQFVASGGGLLVGELGWGWLQLNPGKTLTEDHNANTLLAPMGIVWADGILDRNSEGGYAAGATPSPLLNASKALDAALAHTEGRAKLTPEEIGLVSTVLSRTAQALPPGDTILLPRIKALAADTEISVVPTPKQPIKLDDMLARLVLTMQLRDASQLPPEQVKALPAAAVFPGAAPEGTPRVTRTVEIDTSVPGWHSTGLYADPGQLLTVQLPEAAAGKGLEIRLGATTCRNWNHGTWLRAPEIDRQFALKAAESEAASAFGGLLYVVVPDKCALGAVPITLVGGVVAPYFELGKTSLDDWRTSIRNCPAPWAELASGKAVLTVQSACVRQLDDPESLLKTWERVLDLCAELAAWPSPDRDRPQRYSADDQICAGYMHAGNPIMIPTSAAGDLVNQEHLTKDGDWGLFHETGHMHQSGDWTFGGAGEVTVNLFTMYVFDKLCGIPPEKGRMADIGMRRSYVNYFQKGPDFSRWTGDPFLALYMYCQLQQGFGWDAYKKVFAEYRDLPADQHPKNDDEKRDQWMVRFSRAVGRNLGPFFGAWGVPTSQPARDSLKDLPTWLPADFPPKELKGKRVAQDAKVIRSSSENADGEASNAVDGFEDTLWHSRWSGEDVPGYPHELVIELGETMELTGLTVLPRQVGINGWISEYEVYVSQDGKSWGAPAAKGAFERSKERKTVQFANPTTCRYLRFVALKGFDNQVWASLAELEVVLAK